MVLNSWRLRALRGRVLPVLSQTTAVAAFALMASAPARAAITTTTTLATNATQIYVGGSLTLMATVTRSPSSMLTGPVTFKDGTTVLSGTPTNSSNSSGETATLVVPVTTPGPHSYTATYNLSGNIFYAAASTSQPVAVNVVKPTTVQLLSNANPVHAGQRVTFSAKVQGNDTVVPTGNVRFNEGASLLGRVAVSATGNAVLDYAYPPGSTATHAVTATYEGSSYNAVATSSALTETVTGRDYYVDSAAAATNTTATVDSPWADFGNIAATKFGKDDRLLLKCNGLWRSQLNLTAANVGTPGSPITVGSWGPSCATTRPVVSAAIQLQPSRWALVSGSTTIYQYTFTAAELPSPTTLPVIQLFGVFGSQVTPMQIARHPNVDPNAPADSRGYFKNAVDATDSSYLTTKAGDQAAVIAKGGADAFTGAYVHVRTSPYRFEDLKVAQYTAGGSGGTITFGADYDGDAILLSANLPADFGYFLTGKDWMLDTAGEWSFNPTTRVLKFWAPGGVNPNTLVLEASVRTHGVTVTDARVNLSDVEVRYAGSEGITLDNVANSVVNNVVVRYSGRVGLGLDLHVVNPPLSNGTTISNSEIAFSHGSGIVTHWVTSEVNIVGNKVTDSGTWLEPRRADTAISAGPGAYIANNSVQRAAYLGIAFSSRVSTRTQADGSVSVKTPTIERNTVEDFCKRLDDCAGIYTFNKVTMPDFPQSQAVVKYNLVRRGQGEAFEGVPANFTRPTGASGIYLDDLTSNVQVNDNVVYDVPYGLNLHNNTDITVQRNSFSTVGHACMSYGHDNVNLTTAGISITDNTCVAGGQSVLYTLITPEDKWFPVAVAVRLEATMATTQQEAMSGLYFANNKYSSLYGPVRFSVQPHDGVHQYDVHGWHQAFSNELDQTGTPPSNLLNQYVATAVGTNIIAGSDFNSGIAGWWYGKNNVNSDVTAHTAAECGGTTPCIGSKNSAASPTFAYTDNATYLLKYRIRTSANHQEVHAGLLCDSWAALTAGLSQYTVSTEWTSFEKPVLVKAPANCGSVARWVFYDITDPDETLYDDVALVPATITLNPGVDDHRVVANNSNTVLAFTCPDTTDTARCSQYVDLNRQPINWPMILNANTSAVIVYTGPTAGTTFYRP